MSILPLYGLILEIQYNDWKFIFSKNENSIIINAQKSKVYKIFEKRLTLNEFLEYNLNLNNSINNLIEELNILFLENKVKIKEEEDYLKLTFESNQINNELILINKENIDSFLLLEYIKLNNNIQLNDKEKSSLNKEINYQNLKLKKLKKKLIINCNPKKIKAHDSFISLISIFPSGNLISVSCDLSIKIWDNNIKLLQNIQKAHLNWIYYVDIKDNKTFVTSSVDRSIKIWEKKENEFQLFLNIENAHNSYITKTIFNKMNNNIISCSGDEKIKIWEIKNNNSFQNLTTLDYGYGLYSILLLNDINLLISSGKSGTKFYNLNNLELICYIKEAKCGNWNCLSRIDNNRLIMGESVIIYIVLINEKKIIEEININFKCSTVYVLENYNLFLCGGNSTNFLIYSTDNYNCIQIINNAHENFINGFLLINNYLLLSYSDDCTIRIWEI